MINSYDHSVDVIIPVYNGERYVARAIESVVKQTYRPNRIIVVDDCSNDLTAQIVQELTETNSSVEYYRMAMNSGPSAARNFGINLASSKFLAFLDSDDLWAPDKLFLQLEQFNKSKYGTELGLVYTNCRDIDKDDQINYNNTFSLNPKVKGNVSTWLKQANLIAGSCSSVLIKKECFDQIGLFDVALEACEDWDLWLRLSKHFKFDYVNADLVFIRRHSLNNQWNVPRMISGHMKFYSKIFCSGDLIFSRIMGYRAWIFRSACGVNTMRDMFRYTANPSRTVELIAAFLYSNSGWNSPKCSDTFKSYFLSKRYYTILLVYLLCQSVLVAIKNALHVDYDDQ